MESDLVFYNNVYHFVDARNGKHYPVSSNERCNQNVIIDGISIPIQTLRVQIRDEISAAENELEIEEIEIVAEEEEEEGEEEEEDEDTHRCEFMYSANKRCASTKTENIDDTWVCEKHKKNKMKEVGDEDEQ